MAKQKVSFEESINSLQKLVESLESGELSLSESLEVYAEAIRLSKECSEMLEEAEQKVVLLKDGETGEKEAVPFPELQVGEGR